MEGKKPKILLCEDDQNLGSVLKNYLELSDFDVTLERDGRLGLAAFQRERFDLCLLDIMMPHMDGFTLAEEIREHRPAQAIVIFSSLFDRQLSKETQRLGFVYCEKAAGIDALEDAISEANRRAS